MRIAGIVSIFILGAVLLSPNSSGSAGTAPSHLDSDVSGSQHTVIPDWDHLAIDRCQGYCNRRYILSRRLYNICYACRCLVAAAETEGELTSAMSQCRAELRPR